MKNFEEATKRYGDYTTKFINEKINLGKSPEILKEACLYSVNAGGKRIRPTIFLITLYALDVEISNKHIAFASALEMIGPRPTRFPLPPHRQARTTRT